MSDLQLLNNHFYFRFDSPSLKGLTSEEKLLLAQLMRASFIFDLSKDATFNCFCSIKEIK